MAYSLIIIIPALFFLWIAGLTHIRKTRDFATKSEWTLILWLTLGIGSIIYFLLKPYK